MKKSLTFFVLFLGLALSLTSCGSADEAQKTSDRFFSLIIKHQYSEAAKLINAVGASDDDVKTALEQIADHPTFGKLKSAEKGMGFNTQINNGVTTVSLPYNLTYEDSEESMEVTMIDRGSGFKIVSVQ